MICKEISSRKNDYIKHLRQLQNSSSYRKKSGEYICDGKKLLDEAIRAGAEVTSVLWKGTAGTVEKCRNYVAPEELFDYVSPMKNSPGPLFTVRIPDNKVRQVKSAVVLENVQDPGNVGTVLRTAAAFNVDAVVLCGECADIFNPKTVRSTMGAIFRQYVYFCEDPSDFAKENGLTLYAAALTEGAKDIREVSLSNAAVCIGNEGHGLSEKMIGCCSGQLIIPMDDQSESLNAAVAASIVMWEMRRLL